MPVAVLIIDGNVMRWTLVSKQQVRTRRAISAVLLTHLLRASQVREASHIWPEQVQIERSCRFSDCQSFHPGVAYPHTLNPEAGGAGGGEQEAR